MQVKENEKKYSSQIVSQAFIIAFWGLYLLYLLTLAHYPLGRRLPARVNPYSTS